MLLWLGCKCCSPGIEVYLKKTDLIAIYCIKPNCTLNLSEDITICCSILEFSHECVMWFKKAKIQSFKTLTQIHWYFETDKNFCTKLSFKSYERWLNNDLHFLFQKDEMWQEIAVKHRNSTSPWIMHQRHGDQEIITVMIKQSIIKKASSAVNAVLTLMGIYYMAMLQYPSNCSAALLYKQGQVLQDEVHSKVFLTRQGKFSKTLFWKKIFFVIILFFKMKPVKLHTSVFDTKYKKLIDTCKID